MGGVFSNMMEYLVAMSVIQFDGLVPHDGVSRQHERLDVHHVHVAVVGADVHPLGLERQVAERYPVSTPPATAAQITRIDLITFLRFYHATLGRRG